MPTDAWDALGGAEQLQNNIYAVLYDLALTLGGHVQVQPLLDAVLQRMLYHTGLPAGFIYLQDEQHPARARLASVVGDFDLKGAAGRSFDAPAGAGDLAYWERIFDVLQGRYRDAHILPIGKLGAIVLLSHQQVEAGIMRYFLPLAGNLEKAIQLCQSHEGQQHELMAKLRLLASVTEHAQNGVLVTDAERRIVEINPAFTKITGYSREEVIGRTPRILSSGRHSREFYDQMNRQLQETGRWQGKIWNRRKNGEVFPEILSISAIRDEQERPTHYISIFTDISELTRVRDQINILANFDPLTMLGNRKTFVERLRDALTYAAGQHGRQIAVVSLDIDGFAAINDLLGPEASDRLLVKIADRLRMSIRPADQLARLGGDEFALLLDPVSNQKDVADHCHALLAALNEEPFAVDRHVIHLTASMGYTLYPQDDGDADTLLRHANAAMFDAKHAGRNRAEPFDAEMNRQLADRQQRLARIGLALRQDELRLHYQPKIDLRSGRVIGVEALMRWEHPERGLVPPGEFLPLAEESDLIVDLGRWSLEEALRQQERWQAQGIHLPVAINLAGRHLLHAGFIDHLQASLQRHPDIAPQMIELEILESSALSDIAHARSVIQQARALGVGFALDDFGTGYSSLSYLKQLPTDTLKLDQSFVRGLLEDFENLALIRAVVGMAAAFNRKLVAEGVETMEHAMLLVQLGCELVQGYGFARPMPAAQLADWLTGFCLPPQLDITRAYQWRTEDYPLLIAGYFPQEHLRRLRRAIGGTPLMHAYADISVERDQRDCGMRQWMEEQSAAGHADLPAFATAKHSLEQFYALERQALACLRNEDAPAAAALLPALEARLPQLLSQLEDLQRTIAAAD